MNLPAAVIAAMALCNQHVVATSPNSWLSWLTSGSIGSTIFSSCSSGVYTSKNGLAECRPETDTARKQREEDDRKRADEATQYEFKLGYAWQPGYQGKCKTIHDYVANVQASEDKKEADKSVANAAAAKAAEQPTLDKGIAALPMIGVQSR